MFECVAGLRGMAISKNEDATSGGCILADDMGYANHILRDVSAARYCWFTDLILIASTIRFLTFHHSLTIWASKA